MRIEYTKTGYYNNDGTDVIIKKEYSGFNEENLDLHKNCKTITVGEPGYSYLFEFEDGKIKEFEKTEIEMVDANINVDIDVPRITNYAPDEKVDARQLRQLEDDRNSSTGHV